MPMTCVREKTKQNVLRTPTQLQRDQPASMKIIIPDLMLPEPLERLRAVHDVLYDPSLVNQRAKLVEVVRDADCIIVRNRTQVRGDLLDAMARCKVVGRLGVGLDNIDVDKCKARGIQVVPAIGANARSVAEYVVTAAMMLLRGAYQATDEVAEGKWPRQAMTEGRELYGRTLGIIGFGSIGQVTGKLAQAMGVRVVGYDRNSARDARKAPDLDCELLSLDQLLETSDVVSLHIPLTPETRGLIGAERIARMKPGSVLVNTARGGIVDESALAGALRRGHLRGATIDVFETEPLGAESVLAGVPNLLLTPHIAGVTSDSELRVGNLIADKVLALLK
jgi:(S)-sulfolactate dehydrogenase